MKKKLLLFALAAITGGFMLSSAASADVTSDTQNFTLDITDAYRWFFNPVGNVAGVTSFGTLDSRDFNATVNNIGTSANHQVILGDGTADSQAANTYMETNSETQANLKTYNLTVAGYNGSTATFTTDGVTLDAGTINVTDTDNGADIDVNFLIESSAFGGAAATLGGETFSSSDAQTLEIATPTFTYVDPLDSDGSSAAALDMGIDFDESTLNYADTVVAASESIGFSLTFTVLAVD